VIEHEFPESWYELADPNQFWMRWRSLAFVAQLRSIGVALDRELRVLDVGAGNGALRSQLEATTRWRIDLCDTNPAVREHRIPGRGGEWVYDVASRDESRLASFDAAILFDVIEHADDPVSLLGDAAAHVRSGGWIFLNVPALPTFHSGYDRAVGHRRRYTRQSLRTEVERAGLRVHDLRYWGFAMVPMLIARWAVQRGEPRDEPERQRWIRGGFQSPNPSIERLLHGIAEAETRWLAPAPIGTSVLCAATRRD
jgi:SAM-dependent methyltransferase